MSDAPFSLTVEIPGTPRGKGAGRAAIVRGHAHVFTDSKTRSELGMIKLAASQAMAGRPPYPGAVSLMIYAYREPPASFSIGKRKLALSGEIVPSVRPDCDNHSKLVCDAFNKVVFVDDCQVVDLVVLKRYDERPRMVVRVKAFGD